MRCVTLLTLAVLIAHNFALHAEDADEVREKGIAALKESQTNPRAIVDAARFFVKAGALYGDAGDEEKNVEMNSFLYWCKKKMTLADIDQFTKGGEAAVTSKLAAVEKAAPKADEAQKWFDRSDQFAKKNPTEHLLIAIRFYEVADRFKGVDLSLQAQDRSLKEIQLVNAPAVSNPTAKTVQPSNNEGTSKLPVPDAAAVKQATTEIRNVYKDEFAKKVPAFSSQLLKQAEDPKTSALDRYVLFRESAQMASLAGDPKLVCSAIDGLARIFQIDPLTSKLDLLSKCLPAISTTEAAKILTFSCDDLITEAISNDQYEIALKAQGIADGAARKAQDAGLLVQVQSHLKEIRDIQAEFGKLKSARDTLKTNPENPEANLAIGSYLCFIRNDFGMGLPLLAKGKDEKLKNLAEKDLANPASADEQIALGDVWWDYSEKLPAAKRKNINIRIFEHYSNAYSNAAGISRLKMEKRLQSMTPPAMTLVLWNQHNGHHNDRGTTECNVVLLNGVKEVWRKNSIPCEWKADDDVSTSIILPPLVFTKVRIEITKAYRNGAGLAEIEVMLNGNNIALGCAASANSIFDNNNDYAASTLTDGITTSKDIGKGYWVTAWTQTGWAEVDLTQKVKIKKKP